ncbi:hypothetical protein ACWA2C_16390 [Priestia megaterium]
MYDKEKQKEMVLQLLKESSQSEIQYTKQQNFERAISIAVDEVKEIKEEFDKFVSSVSHLEVFQATIKEPLTRDMSKMLENLQYLIEKNYTQEDKQKMPETVLEQVRASQEKRIDLLKRVAKRYLSRPK